MQTQHNAAMQKLKDNVDAGEEKIKAVDAEVLLFTLLDTNTKCSLILCVS